MAQPGDPTFHPCSPTSEGGADSFKYEDTPDTRLSSYSPHGNSAKTSRLLNALALSTEDADAQPIKFQVPHNGNVNGLPRMTSLDSLASVIHDKDPFITTSRENPQGEIKLSATASTFQPVSVTPIVASGATNSMDTPKATDRNLVPNAQVLCSPLTGARVYNHVPLSSILSKDMQLSRSLSVTSSVEVLTADAINGYLQKFQVIDGAFERYPDVFPCGEVVYLRFTNIRDSSKILKDETVKPLYWNIKGVNAQEINKRTGIAILADENEGLHSLSVYPMAELTDDQLKEKIKGHFKHWNVFALVKQPITQPGITKWIIEMSDFNATYGCATQLYARGWMPVDNSFLMLLSPLSPGSQPLPYFSVNDYSALKIPTTTVSDLAAQLNQMSFHNPQSSIRPVEQTAVPAVTANNMPQYTPWPGQWYFSAQTPQLVQPSYPGFLTRGSTPTASSLGVQVMTPMSQKLPGTGSMLSPPLSTSMSVQSGFQRSDSRRRNATRVTRSSFSPPGPHHNHVDINKIREGTDVRTTIMLRNIPNKVDQAMLKNIVDESSWGKYDFMYLRIDFANDCNVGYAFINFVDPLDIIDFVNARGNQRWNCFKSDKVAEISYATIQGKDCLVQKFRNSSVMLEAAHYRPKLYYTSNGPTPQMAGQEEPFPEPDNQSKMKRSCENAEHVGLFTPNAGQHFRDEQRRRRSQYDRGTRLAALEECGDYGMYRHPESIH